MYCGFGSIDVLIVLDTVSFGGLRLDLLFSATYGFDLCACCSRVACLFLFAFCCLLWVGGFGFSFGYLLAVWFGLALFGYLLCRVLL